MFRIKENIIIVKILISYCVKVMEVTNQNDWSSFYLVKLRKIILNAKHFN